jgi:predicted PurR-regulated permease PerM
MKGNLNTTQLFQLLLILLLLVWCFLIIQPFILLLIWAIILAVALYPLYNQMASRFAEGKRKWATALFALILALVLFLPLYYLVDAIVTSSSVIVEQLQQGTLEIPGPDPSVADWPLIGERLYGEWKSFAENTQQYAIDHKEVILETGGSLLSSLGGFFGSLILFVVSFLISVVFMHNADQGRNSAAAFLKKVAGDQGQDILTISRDTIRSVVKGILLVALIQTILALVGLKIAGIPAAGVFAFLVLVFAIVQIPVFLVLLPHVIISFSTLDTTAAVVFSVYMIAISLSDNILKPIFLGKGLQTPIIIILIGSIGGMLLHGIIGLFVGAVVLAVAHRLYTYWVQSSVDNA